MRAASGRIPGTQEATFSFYGLPRANVGAVLPARRSYGEQVQEVEVLVVLPGQEVMSPQVE